jgi:hypothetical protein
VREREGFVVVVRLTAGDWNVGMRMEDEANADGAILV